MMHHAHLATSERLQRVLVLLSDGAEHSTRDIVMGAGVMAVSAIISELRTNGLTIRCRHTGRAGQRVCYYRLETGS